MTEPETLEIGWQVLDPEGNVVDSGPLIVMTVSAAVAEVGDPAENPQE